MKGKNSKSKQKDADKEDSSAIILDGPAMQNFLSVLHSEQTKETYQHRMLQYLKYRGWKSADRMLKDEPEAIQKDVINYLLYLRNEKHLSHASRQVVLAMFRKFYSQNDIMLNWDKIHNYLGAHERTVEDRAYSRQEVRKLLEVADIRGRVLILLLASTGLRRGAVSLIRHKHLKFLPEHGLYQITTYPKARERYTTFCTPECAKQINEYFAYRKQCGEVLNDDSPLIREQFHADDKEKAAKPTPAKNEALKMLLVRIVRLAGVKTAHQKHDDGRPTQRTEIFLSHGLRKYFDTALANARLHPVKLAALMGHKEGLQRSYLRASDAELLEEYVKALDHLTVNDENKLRAQVEKLRSEAGDMSTVRESLATLHGKYEWLQEQYLKLLRQAQEKGEVVPNPPGEQLVKQAPV